MYQSCIYSAVIENLLQFWKFPTALLQKVCRPAWGTNHLHTKNCRIYRSNPNLGATKLQLFCNNKQLYVLPWGKIIFPTKYIQNKIWLPRHSIAYLLTKSQWSWKPIWSHIWFMIHFRKTILRECTMWSVIDVAAWKLLETRQVGFPAK